VSQCGWFLGKEARIRELREEASGLGPMIDGCLQTKRNRVENKDGKVQVSPAHHQVQYRGANGKTRWKSVPARHLDASPQALKDLLYLEKRKDNMRYGWLRRNGYYIGSGHVEAAV
jgi:hypothetical protein